MRANRSRDTGPELAIRSRLYSRGYRYRVNFRPERDIRRTADIVFRSARVAVFIDGCFWHGCPIHGTFPKSNARYWASKIHQNRERDMETTRLLEARGWTVLRIWEHEPVDRAVEQIAASLPRR